MTHSIIKINNLTNLSTWNLYYDNGKIKEEGIETKSSDIKIGLWKYYSKNGSVDSTIDYDKKYKISYFRALEIAEKEGYKLPKLEVTFKIVGQRTYWQFTSWTKNKDGSEEIGIAILMDSQNGQTIRPKEPLFKKYEID